MDSRRELTQTPGHSPKPVLIMLAALAVGIFVGVLIARWSWRGPDRSLLLAQLRQRGVVRVGFANESPFGFLDDTGRLTGESPEIARVIFQKMGIHKVEGVLTDFGSLIPELNAGRFDMIAASMYITPERQQRVAFSLPINKTRAALLVKKGNPRKLHSFDDIREKKAIVAVMSGTVDEEAVREAAIPAAKVFFVPDLDTGVKAVRNGTADGFALTRIAANYLAKRFDMNALEQAEPFHDVARKSGYLPSQCAFGFRHQDDELRREFNRHLAEFIGTPEHLALVAKFGIDSASIPNTQNGPEQREQPRP